MRLVSLLSPLLLVAPPLLATLVGVRRVSVLCLSTLAKPLLLQGLCVSFDFALRPLVVRLCAPSPALHPVLHSSLYIYVREESRQPSCDQCQNDPSG